MLRITGIRSSAALASAALITLTVSVGWVWLGDREAVHIDRRPFTLFPRQISEWSGASSRLTPEVEAVLGADDYLHANYFSGDSGEMVNMFVAFYNKQTEGSGIHSPEVCLPVGGWMPEPSVCLL